MKFSHRVPSDQGEVIRRYICQICGAEVSTWPNREWRDNIQIRAGSREASGKIKRTNYKLLKESTNARLQPTAENRSQDHN